MVSVSVFGQQSIGTASATSEIDDVYLYWSLGTNLIVSLGSEDFTLSDQFYEKSFSVIEDCDFTNKELTVYPNPFTQEIKIAYGSNDYISGYFEVRDLNGKLIEKGILNNESIWLAHLRSGIYIMHVQIGDYFVRDKFLKL